MTDPFMDDPTPESIWDEGEQDSKDNEKESKVLVQNNNDGKVVVTLKGGSSFDSPWIVIHADSIEDADNQLNDKALGKLIDRTSEVGQHFANKGGGSAPPKQQSSDKPKGKPDGADQSPKGETRNCEHGQMSYKSGFSEKKKQKSKDGNGYWEAFDCPAGKCERQWAN